MSFYVFVVIILIVVDVNSDRNVVMSMDEILRDGEDVIDDLVEMYVRVGLENEEPDWFERGREAFERATRLRENDFDLWIQIAELDAKHARNIKDSMKSLKAFARAIEIDPQKAKMLGIKSKDVAGRLLSLSTQLDSKTERREVVRIAKSVLKKSQFDELSTKVPPLSPPPPLPNWYAPMLNDHRRNKAFADAIRHVVTSSTESVCDIGTGSGLLGILAAKSGAQRVIGIEIEPSLVRVAQLNAERNNVQDRFRIVTGHSSQIEIGETRCEVLVSEVLDDNLIGPSDWLGTLRNVRTRLLSENAIVIPSNARIYAVPIESSEIRDIYSLPDEIEGVRIDDLKTLWKLPETVHGTIQLAGLQKYRVLAQNGEIELYRWDFQHDDIDPVSLEEQTIEIEITQDDGILDAVVVLWDANLVDEIVVSNRPHIINGEFMNWNHVNNDNTTKTCNTPTLKWLATNHWSQEAMVFTNGGLHLRKGMCKMRVRHDSEHFYFDFSACV